MAEWADGLNDADEWDFDVDNFLPTLSSGKKCDIKVSEGKSNLWLGRAQVWIEGDHITKGDVKVNTDLLDSLFDDDFDDDHVLCQEFGHVFGLNHSGDSDTCMNDSILGQPTPNAHDFDELFLYYNHVDSGGGGDGPISVVEFMTSFDKASKDC